MKTTVVVTCHNGGLFLREQLFSIAVQSRLPDQIVFGDDASTDSSVEIASELLSGLPVEVRVLQTEERLGLRANLARCLGLATGDLVFFADHDDVWRPDKLERMAAVFEARDEVGLAFSDARVVDGSGQSLGRSLWDEVGFDPAERTVFARDPVRVLSRRTVVTGATMAARRRLVEAAMPVPESAWHDEWLALACVLKGSTPMAVAEKLIDYRVHGANSAGLPRRGLRERLAREGWPGEAKVAAWGEACDRFGPSSASRHLQGAIELARARPGPRTALVERARRVAHLARCGAYRRYGRGWPMALHDLVAPALHGRAQPERPGT